MVNDSHPLPIRLAPHVPQTRKGEKVFSFEMHPHRDLSLSLFPPLVEAVSGYDAPATADEMLECRLLRQRLGTGVDRLVSYRRVLGPRWDQPPSHEPTFVAATVTDNHGNVG